MAAHADAAQRSQAAAEAELRTARAAVAAAQSLAVGLSQALMAVGQAPMAAAVTAQWLSQQEPRPADTSKPGALF